RPRTTPTTARGPCAACPAGRTGTSTSAPAPSRCATSQSSRAASMRTSRRRPSSPAAVGLLLVLLAPVVAAAHPQSVSYAQIVIHPRSIDLLVRLPLDDVDLLLRLDRDLDGRVAPAEIESSRAVVAGYLIKHTHLVAAGAPLTPAIGRLAVWRDPSG